MAFVESPVDTGTEAGPPNKPTSFADSLMKKFKVKPVDVKGIGGFVFDYEGDTDVREQAEITDHYLEDNSPANDHIALKPEKITLRGYVGELVVEGGQGLTGALSSIQNKLTTVPAYLGKYTPGQIGTLQKAVTKAANVANAVDQALSRVNNIVGIFKKASPKLTKQQRAYGALYTLMLTKQIFTVETPYNVHLNMAIESISFLQDETTKFWSDISVTLKQMRFVGVDVSSKNKNANRQTQRVAPTISKGRITGTTTAPQIGLAGFPGHDLLP